MESNKANDFGYIDGVAQEERVTELSDEQGMAIASVKGFMDGNGFGHYVIGGVAGSGKSTVIPYIVDECGTPYSAGTGQGSVAVCAYTGKAVMNLKRKGIPNAMTLHSFLYDTRVSTDSMTGEKIVVHSRKDDCCFRGIRLLIVDEASMVGREMFDVIESLPFKTVYIGDHFQLPPVNDKFNIMEKPDFRMERIHRQELDNPIVALADMARNGKPIPLGVFGSSKHTRSLDRSDLPAYSEIVTWTNATKDAVNECIRESRGFQKDVPQVDDKLTPNP